MHFVDRDGSGKRIRLRALLQPSLIVPFETPHQVHARSSLRSQLHLERIGISLVNDPIILSFDLKFVELSFRQTWHEDFPYTGRTQNTHRMFPSIPPIEI